MATEVVREAVVDVAWRQTAPMPTRRRVLLLAAALEVGEGPQRRPWAVGAVLVAVVASTAGGGGVAAVLPWLGWWTIPLSRAERLMLEDDTGVGHPRPSAQYHPQHQHQHQHQHRHQHQLQYQRHSRHQRRSPARDHGIPCLCWHWHRRWHWHVLWHLRRDARTRAIGTSVDGGAVGTACRQPSGGGGAGGLRIALERCGGGGKSPRTPCGTWFASTAPRHMRVGGWCCTRACHCPD